MPKCKNCGKTGLLLHLSSGGLCQQCVEQELMRLENLLSPDILDAIQRKESVIKLDARIAELGKEVERLDGIIDERKNTIAELDKRVIIQEETIEMESFSLYRPIFEFATSEEYKSQLVIIRENQKDLIRKGMAATGNMKWTVNDSATQGKKLVNDMIKLCLRSFNNECDAAVGAVKFNNFDRMLDRIMKSYEAIEKLGKIMSVSISKNYLGLKIQELHLALEYQKKKEEEKEARKELRAQQREAERVARELEEQRKLCEKEQKHYEKAYDQLNKQYLACTDEVQKANLYERLQEIKGQIDSIAKRMEDIDYREANQRAGYVYIISNIGAFGDGVFKIGMTRRLDPQDRVDELGDASVPFNFDIHALIFSDDAPALEAALHRAFEDRKVNMVNQRREFFRVSLDEIKEVIRKNYDKAVEFHDIPAAEQYRETLRIAGNL